MSQTGIQVQVKKLGEKKRRRGSKRGGEQSKPPGPVIPAQDRETRIDFTLDMVLNDLVQQGHLNPAKSYMIKTDEMREHIGRMCDRVHRRKHGFPEKDPAGPSAAADAGTNANPTTEEEEFNQGLAVGEDQQLQLQLQEQEQPTTSIFKKLNLKRQESGTTAKKSPASRKRSTSVKSRKEKGTSTPAPGGNKAPTAKGSKMGKKKGAGGGNSFMSEENPNYLALDAVDHMLMKSPVQQPGAAFQRMNEKFEPELFQRTADVQAYQATVDLRGFHDEHINLELDGRRLIIVAQRPQNDDLKIHARKVIEIIDIPEGVDLQNLKIGRGSDGSVLVEEFS